MATTSAERMRWKRARDRGMVWGEGDESQLSDTALIEQLAIACQKAREGQGNAIALGLLREIAARIGLSGKVTVTMGQLDCSGLVAFLCGSSNSPGRTTSGMLVDSMYKLALPSQNRSMRSATTRQHILA